MASTFAAEEDMCWSLSVQILYHEYIYGTLNLFYWNVHICIVICTAFTYVTHEHVLLNVIKVFLSSCLYNNISCSCLKETSPRDVSFTHPKLIFDRKK